MRLLLSVYAPPALLLAAVAAKCARDGISPSYFMSEPQTLGGLDWHAGLCATLTGLLWCAAASAALLGWGVLRARGGQSGRGGFLLHFGLLTLALMFDDMFQLHEYAYKYYLGLPETAVYAAYGAASVYGLYAYRAVLRATDLSLLASAIVFLGLSIVVDTLQDAAARGMGPWRILIEDGFKMLGAGGWFAYLWRASLRFVS
ncbi:MAG: hypothetical protein Q8T11_08190 [Elusimicrobiota bacterium]|nr:hypothetical protein [Elusimicrobiota bacterium]